MAREKIAKEDDEGLDDKESCCEKVFMGFLTLCNILKMIMMIGLVIYFWVWTADNRDTDMDVIEQLIKKGSLNLTFHENRLFGSIKNGIDETAKEKLGKIKRE